MRVILYGLSCVALLAGGLGIALLPRLISDPMLFMLAGAVFSGVITVAWLGAGATAGSWPRPRARQVVIAAALAGLLINLWSRHMAASLWSVLVLTVTIAANLPRFLARPARPARPYLPGPVRPPLKRREHM